MKIRENREFKRVLKRYGVIRPKQRRLAQFRALNKLFNDLIPYKMTYRYYPQLSMSYLMGPEREILDFAPFSPVVLAQRVLLTSSGLQPSTNLFAALLGDRTITPRCTRLMDEGTSPA